MPILLTLALAVGLIAQAGKDPLLSQLAGKWSGTADTEQGETTYRLLPDGKMSVVDRVKGKDGTWRTFGQSGLMKR